MDAWFGRILDTIPGPANIAFDGARQARHSWSVSRADFTRDALYRLEIVRRSCREARFNDINAQARKLPRDFQLLRAGQGRARALFAVAQRGVEI